MNLSPRQREVLQLVADGHDWKRVADTLGTAYHTSREHFAQARRKLGARNRAHAVAIAMRKGLIE